jgi:hypothetical protein
MFTVSVLSPNCEVLIIMENSDGGYRVFSCDPGLKEVYWWLGVPLALFVFVVTVYAVAPKWYMAWVYPEGYGILEVLHLLMPAAGFIIAVRLLFDPFVRSNRLAFIWLLFAALACLYIAGEEHSWGQHFFQWNTPEYWSSINRQNETNLHNTIDLFDKNPRLLLELGILFGGIIIPIISLFAKGIRQNRFSLFIPARAMFPVALGALVFKPHERLVEADLIEPLVFRPSEVSETYYYMFILFYLVVFARRIREIEHANRETIPA